ncbi:hypothetical protein K1719_045903 [Acacia pycnantha]|nr:hypothetical protein K1719_045903 [Acacia pycnantha]
MSKLEVPPKGGFSFDLCRRNAMLEKKGHTPKSFLKTGTTIVGLIFQCNKSLETTAAPRKQRDVGAGEMMRMETRGEPAPEKKEGRRFVSLFRTKTRLHLTLRGPICTSVAVVEREEARRWQDRRPTGGEGEREYTRATEGPIVADKNCEKIHYMAPNIYCCGAGTAADTEAVTDMVSSQLQLHRYHTGRESRVVTALTLLKKHLFNYQGYVQAALVLGGVDVTGPHLHTIYPHGSTDSLPFATMGSGSLAAMSLFESNYKEGLTRDEGVQLVVDAICAGIFNDLGSGSNVDVCVITKGHKDYLRNHLQPNPRTYVNPKGFTFPKKTEVLLTKITPLKERVEVIEGGDAMEE